MYRAGVIDELINEGGNCMTVLLPSEKTAEGAQS